MTVKELYDQLGPHWGDMPVVFVVDEATPMGFPEWRSCRVRYDRDEKRLEIVLDDCCE